MPLESSFALTKKLFCYMPNRNLFILRKSLLSSLSSWFRFALAKMSFCFMRNKSLSMFSKSLLLSLFKEFRVVVKFSLQG
jgi:hypothetical protein